LGIYESILDESEGYTGVSDFISSLLQVSFAKEPYKRVYIKKSEILWGVSDFLGDI